MADDLNLTTDELTPGLRLRIAREALGMTLDDVARVTCIGKSYLEALETGHFERLPNSAYVMGGIRSYAEAVGLPPEPLITSYRLLRESREGDDELLPVHNRTGAGNKLWLLVLGSVVVIGVGSLLLQRGSRVAPESRPSDQAMPVITPQSGVFPLRTTSDRLPSAPVMPVVVPVRETPVASPKAAVAVVLKITVVEECLLTMTIDDAPAQQYDLKPGDEIEWMGERYFALEMTNAGAVEAELNGKTLHSLGKSGTPATVVISADGQIE